MENKKITLFVDLVGRTIIGNLIGNLVGAEGTGSDSVIKIQNPAIIHIQPVASKTPGQGQVQVQVLPYILPEFITGSKRKEPIVWSFSSIGINVPENLEIDNQLILQYERLFSPIVIPSAGQVINLFDEKK